MRRILLRSATFVRAAKRLLKKHPDIGQDLHDALVALEEDAFNPSLKTHKLKGDLSENWACSVGYDLRILFRFVEHDGTEAILLQTIGTHDEVY